MAKRKVILTLTTSSPPLTAVGHLFPKNDEPPEEPRTAPSELSLTEDRSWLLESGESYVFRFKVQNASGKFTIKAHTDQLPWTKKKDYDTQNDGNVGLRFEFDVP